MTDFPAMPDFLAALERDLRAAVARPASAARRHPGRRLAVAITVIAALAVSFLLASGPHGRRGTPAFAGPLILRQPTVSIPEQFRTLGVGALVAQRTNEVGRRAARTQLRALLESGRRIQTRSARQVPAFGATAYLLGAPGVWCLTAPDPATQHPDVEVGVTCAPAREFARIGIALMIGRHYVAAIPQGVPNPVLQRADGTTTTLTPDDDGLVVLETLGRGETVTRADNQGHTQLDR